MEKQITGGLKIPHPTFLFPSRQPPLKLISFSNLHTYHPGLGYLFDVSGDSTIPIQLDSLFRAKHAEHSVQEPKIVHLELENAKSKDEFESRSAFMKVTHLLDPITWIRGKYDLDESQPPDFFTPSSLPHKAYEKITDPMNQAYVEAVASYSLSKLREADVSPHFHYFYGAYCGIADSYSYNISDVYSSYRHCRWFWDNQKKKIFSLEVDTDELDPEVKEAIFEPPSELHSEVSSEVSEDELANELEELDDSEENHQTVELQSLHSTAMSSVSFKTQSEEDDDDDEDYEDEDDDDDEDEDEEINVLARLEQFPVMLLFTEPSKGTMDELLSGWEGEGEDTIPGEKEWEEIWTAWMFQILAALSVVQTFFGFTHNDLHTNNIVWTHTDQKYFFYTNRDGTVWRIPTYGKVFRLIDFGRAIFWINDKLFFSDDFKEGNDAAEQFSFGPLRVNENEEEVYPNPSFDLSRLAVSLFEALFPMKPESKKGGVILSNEPGLIVYESKSPLYNLLWSWMIDDDGKNVLMEANGRERYPDFDLYKVITQKVHGAVPKTQILRPIFDKYKMGKQSVGKKTKVYNLFF
jgi:hypothetical protein